MPMLLTSNGIHEGPTLDALQGLLDKPIAEARTVVVLDAMLPFPGDKSTMLRNIEQYRALGWAEVDVLTLFSGPRSLVGSRLRGADVVYCYGGTNHWLAHEWTRTGLAPVLRELLEEKVYVGLSAGSMIFSRRHAAAVEALEDQEELAMLQLDEVGPALPLFDWSVAAHLGAPYFPHATDAWAASVAPRFGGPVWFLSDGSALVVRDPEAEPEIVSNGHWLHFDAAGTLVASA